MSLFPGDEMIDVELPDGRAMRLPKSLAGALAGVMPVNQSQPEPATPEPGAVPSQPYAPAPMEESPVDTIHDIASVVGVQPSAPYAAGVQGSDPNVAQVDAVSSVGAPVPAQDNADSRREYAERAALEADARRPPPSVRDIGPDGALAGQQNALQEQAKAAVAHANNEAAGQALVAKEVLRRNSDTDKLIEDLKKKQEAEVREFETKKAQVDALRDKFANTKIDRTHDHPFIAAIGVVLAAIGMKRDNVQGPNPAVDAYFKAIDRKVAGQMADLDKLGKSIGWKQEDVEHLRKSVSNQGAMRQLLISSELERSARYIEGIVATTTSERLRLGGTQKAAEFRTLAANNVMDAVQKQVAHDQQVKFHNDGIKQQIADRGSANWRHKTSLDQDQKQFDDTLQFNKEKEVFDYGKALEAARATGGSAAAKQVAEDEKDARALGIRNLTTGKFLLNEEGTVMMADADKLAADAAQIRANSGGALSPGAAARADALEAKASEMRGIANTRHVIKHRDPTQAGALATKYSQSQAVMTLTDNINLLYDVAGRSYLSTNAKQAAVQAAQVQMLMSLKNAWQLGVLSKQDTALLDKATGGDATKGWDTGNIASVMGLEVGMNPEAFKARLKSINDDLEGQVVTDLVGLGWDVKERPKLFGRKEAPTATPETSAATAIKADQTPGELAKDQREVGVVGDVVQRGAYRNPLKSKEEAAEDIENAGSAKYLGMSANQAKHMDTLLTSLGKGNKKAEEQLIEQAKSTRTDLGVSTARVLRERAPEVYQKVLKALPANSTTRKQLEDDDKTKNELALVTKPSQREPSKFQRKTPELQPNDMGANVAAAAARTAVLVKTSPIQLAQEALIGKKDAEQELARRAGAGGPDAKTAQNLLEGVINSRKRREPAPPPFQSMRYVK